MKARAAILGAFIAGAAMAQDQTGPNLAASGGGAPGGVAQLAFAHQLFALGVARKDAVDVVAAARLARAVRVTGIAREKVTTPVEGAPVDAQTGGTGAPVGPLAMLDAARQLAGNDETLQMLVDRAAAEVPDGRVTAAESSSDLGAGQRDAWSIAFFGGDLAEVAVVGDGDTSLALRVTDETDTTICLNSGPGDTAYCAWVPAWNGRFTVTVTNRGALRNSYQLLTN